ncbi:hypothetical protein E1269_19885 [Jiangella asiatica]|uniref:Polysaccharide chain length determinant N-terminal domain-containing protein n=1 Tax=Jiangella asiatica TaxID=2530372 RepID=A0A4R5D819_9ACTN|nr:hypothetical protein E1269_19885 [Jiangella asiatica]
MDVWRITLAALRRWYVLLPLLALTGLAAVSMGEQVAPEYEAQAGAMITPPRAEAELVNPYGSLTNANEALGIVLNSVDTRRTVAEQGLSSAYEIGVASRSTIMQVSIRADTPEVAVGTGQAVLDLAVQELATRQTDAGLPAEAQFTLSVLEPPAVTAVVDTGSVRVKAVVAVIGAGLSLLVAVLFDDIVGLWRRSQEKRRPARRRQTVATADANPARDENDETVITQRVVPAEQAGGNGANLPRRGKSRAKAQRQAAARRRSDDPREPSPDVRVAQRIDPPDNDGDRNLETEATRHSGWIGPHGERPRRRHDELDRSAPSVGDDATAESSTDSRTDVGAPTSSGAARH